MSKELNEAIQSVRLMERKEVIETIKKHGLNNEGVFSVDFTKGELNERNNDELPCIAAYDSEDPTDFLVKKIEVDANKGDWMTIYVETKDEREPSILHADDVFIGQLREVIDYIE